MPADVAYVATLRLTAARLAARCDLTVDDIEDLRLAVDEACALLLPHALPGTTLNARFALAAGRLGVDASRGGDADGGRARPRRLRVDGARRPGRAGRRHALGDGRLIITRDQAAEHRSDP